MNDERTEQFMSTITAHIDNQKHGSAKDFLVFRVEASSLTSSVRGRFLSIISWDPNASKSNRLHGTIVRLFIINLGYIL